jgi:hypothetical protein
MHTVADLIRKLESYNPDSIILLAKDSEGNEYSSLEDISVELVELEYEGGEVEDIFNKEELLDGNPDMTDSKLALNFKEALVFWPV